jgi:uncharacterized membrane protein YraQ (UPF0718 family)
MLNRERRRSGMLISTVVLGIIALTLLAVGYFKGEGAHISGIRSALGMTLEVLPLLVFAFITAGMIQVLLSHEVIARWVGPESGFRGILVGSIAGGLCPGGPFVSLPIAAGLLRSGASVGTMVAFITGWSLLAVSRLPMEVGILGWQFTLIRLVSTAIFPILAGLIAQLLFGGPK